MCIGTQVEERIEGNINSKYDTMISRQNTSLMPLVLAQRLLLQLHEYCCLAALMQLVALMRRFEAD